MRVPGVLVAIIVTLALGACRDASKPVPASRPAIELSGGSGTVGAEAPPDEEGQPDGSCDVTIDGKTPLRFQAVSAGLGFHTDYWMGKSEMEGLLAYAAAEDEGLEDSAVPAYVDEHMKGDPIFSVLAVNCLGDDVQVTLAPSEATKYAHVRLGPGAYPVFGAEPAPAGSFVASVSGGEWTLPDGMIVPTPGRIVITRFDRSQIDGMFSFPAKPTARAEVREVHGNFTFSCVDSAVCGK